MSEGSVRERLLEAAGELFYNEGPHTVGIDRVLARAGVAKASLYSTFGNKDGLVRAYLEDRHAYLRNRVEKRVAAAPDARARVLAVFDVLIDRVAESNGNYRGCVFIRASTEGAPGDSPARAASAAYRAWRRELLRKLVTELGVADPDGLSQELSVLYDGAAMAAAVDGGLDAPRNARHAAETLLDAARPTKPARKRTK